MSQSYIRKVKKEKYKITYELIDTDLTVDELIQDPEIKEILEQTDLYWFSDDPDTGKVSDFWIAVHVPRVVDEASFPINN
uniref:hypothetical protein n=1 Tax=Microscilla sp. PRE1 TaxID=155537 RepID=UPI001469EA4B|nr:hypothetical protein [Microscilla sp. PRE1]